MQQLLKHLDKKIVEAQAEVTRLETEMYRVQDDCPRLHALFAAETFLDKLRDRRAMVLYEIQKNAPVDSFEAQCQHVIENAKPGNRNTMFARLHREVANDPTKRNRLFTVAQTIGLSLAETADIMDRSLNKLPVCSFCNQINPIVLNAGGHVAGHGWRDLVTICAQCAAKARTEKPCAELAAKQAYEITTCVHPMALCWSLLPDQTKQLWIEASRRVLTRY